MNKLSKIKINKIRKLRRAGYSIKEIKKLINDV